MSSWRFKKTPAIRSADRYHGIRSPWDDMQNSTYLDAPASTRQPCPTSCRQFGYDQQLSEVPTGTDRTASVRACASPT